MTLPTDPSPELSGYACPERLVSADWLQANIASPDLVILESNEDVLLYDTGHIEGALKIDWHTDLNDPVIRDFVDEPAFARLVRRLGIHPGTTVVIYGDKTNWWAAYALWVFTLFGHPDVRILNGGRDLWVAERRGLVQEIRVPSPSDYPAAIRDDIGIRAFARDVLDRSGSPLIDVRSPGEFAGAVTFVAGHPLEGTLQGGHVPGARNVPWSAAAAPDGRFKSREALDEIYLDGVGLQLTDEVIVYCRIGERSAHTWFVLTYLVGVQQVRNYDGSWAEWGNIVRAPIERGSDRASVWAEENA